MIQTRARFTSRRAFSRTPRGAVSLVAAALIAFAHGPATAEIAPGDVVIENVSIADSLTGQPGDPAAGREIFQNRKQGNCLACHANADLSEQLFHGEVGPALDGVAGRWTPEQLRAILVNSRSVFTDRTIMPSFYSLDLGADVAEQFQGKTILSAQEIEDVLAYLTTLK